MYFSPVSLRVRRPAATSWLRRAVAFAVIGATLLVAAPGKALAAGNPATVARHGMTSADFQTEFDHWGAAGFRLTSVSGYDDNGQERYAAIWRQVPGPAWQAYIGMTSQQYQAKFDQMNAQGYRPVVVDGYQVAGTTHFAAIFSLDRSVAWVARHDLTATQYQAEFDTLVAQGYRLSYVSGYTSGDAERYAAIWERSPSPAWRAFHAYTMAQFQALFNQMTGQGYRLDTVSSYRVGGVDKYAGIFVASAPYPWLALGGLDATSYQQQVTNRALQGFVPVQVSVAGGTGVPRFTAIWEKRP